MKKIIAIGLFSSLSFAAYGCAISGGPTAQNPQPTTPISQSAQRQEKIDRANGNEQTTQNQSDREPVTRETTPIAATPIAATPIAATQSISAAEKPTESPSSTATLAQPALSNVTATRQDRSWEKQGTASTGEFVTLSFDSIQVATRSLGRTQPPTYFFQYKIGRDRVYAVTACDGTFSTSLDGDHYETSRRPESEATQKMLDRVCNAWVRPAQVLSPPSHVRMGPKDKIICTLQTSQNITTYGHYEDWVYTNACGKLGLIHSSQIRST
jgi:hypothetical protein